MNTEVCPEHGKTRVTDPHAGTTRGSDPYVIMKLACGHHVVAVGPDPDDVAIVTRRVLP